MIKRNLLYFPFLALTSLHREVEWHDDKAALIASERHILLSDCERAFLDSERIVGLSKTSQSALFDRMGQLVIVEEERYFVRGRDLWVVFTPRGNSIRVITAYHAKDRDARRVARYAYAFKGEPALIGVEQYEQGQSERWAVIGQPNEAQYIAHEVVHLGEG